MESGKKRIITEAEMEKQHEYARSISAMISGGKNACVITYGCQQNEADSERMVHLPIWATASFPRRRMPT